MTSTVYLGIGHWHMGEWGRVFFMETPRVLEHSPFEVEIYIAQDLAFRKVSPVSAYVCSFRIRSC